MKYLITGCSGYLGGKFAAKLSESNRDFLCLGRFNQEGINRIDTHRNNISFSSIIDLQDYINSWLEDELLIVIHFASKFTSKHLTSEVSDIIDSNIKYGTEILESIAGLPQKKFINICSAWQSSVLYPDLYTLYGSSKQAFLQILDFYKKESNVDYSNIYLFDNYGENDSRGKIVQLLIEAAITGKRLDLGSKNQLINLLHVDDVIAGVLAALDLGKDLKNIMVQSNDFISLGELSEEVKRIHGRDLPLFWDTREARPITTKKIDYVSNLPPNWTQKITLPDGLKRVYDLAIQKVDPN